MNQEKFMSIININLKSTYAVLISIIDGSSDLQCAE